MNISLQKKESRYFFRFSAVFLLGAAIFFSLSPDSRATFLGEAKTGFQNVPIGQYGYVLYVPEDYQPDRSWPLVIVLPDEGKLAEESIQEWIGEAKKRGFIVLSPNSPVPRSLPDETDKWILDRKKEVTAQYAIDSNQILLTGSGYGGHYALYLGLRYPSEFSAVASIGDAFQGRFVKLFGYAFRSVNQLPVLILKDSIGDQDGAKELEVMRSRGYSVEIVQAESGQKLSAAALSPQILDWFQKIRLQAQPKKEEKSVGIKEKIYNSVNQLFQNR